MVGRPVNSQYLKSPHNSQLPNQSIRPSSSKFNNNRSNFYGTNNRADSYRDGSMIYSRGGNTVNRRGGNNSKLFSYDSCKVFLDFDVVWEAREDERKQLKQRIEEVVEFNELDLESEEGILAFYLELKAMKNLGIRNDAVIKIDPKKCTVDKIFRIVGKVKQKLINIEDEYSFYFNKVKNGNL